jgi:hypothetical protein
MTARLLPPVKRYLMDPYWRRARIAARILLRKERGALTARDRRLAARLAGDPGVTGRLVDQAASFTTAQKNGYRLMDRRD